MNNKQLSEKLKDILDLRYEPVAVKLIHKGEEIPELFEIPPEKLSHCQSIMQARKGEGIVIPADMHKCVVGASSLGLVHTPTKVRSGAFHRRLGMFGDNKAASKMIEERVELEEGSVIATIVSPLKDVDFEPDVVIIVDQPETLYWLVSATVYEDGGRVELSTAPFQATCVDTTLIPLVTGKINLSLGCYGCRRVTDIQNDEMIAGFPFKELQQIVNNLEEIHDGPMKKIRGK